jgi:hypothetical protein
MNYLELLARIEEMIENEEVNQFDEIDLNKIFKEDEE